MDPININQITGPKLVTADLQVSSRDVSPTLVQRGTFTLAAGVALVQFYETFGSTDRLMVLVTPQTANQQFVTALVTSAFTVSGSGTDAGDWMAMGYKGQ